VVERDQSLLAVARVRRIGDAEVETYEKIAAGRVRPIGDPGSRAPENSDLRAKMNR
jgi:hypothetical protein